MGSFKTQYTPQFTMLQSSNTRRILREVVCSVCNNFIKKRQLEIRQKKGHGFCFT